MDDGAAGATPFRECAATSDELTYVLVPSRGHPVFGRPLIRRLAFGSSVPELAPEDLREFPVARLEAAIEESIANKAERASTLRVHSDRQEDEAVHLVEEFVGGALQETLSRVRQPNGTDADHSVPGTPG
jgi:hypothetical protein